MTILFTGRRAHLTPALKEFAEAKLEKLSRLLDGIVDAHVILKVEKHRHLSEIVVKARMATLTAKADAADFRDSIGLCVDRLLAQAKKHHGRLTTRRRGRGAWNAPRRGPLALEEARPSAPAATGDGGPPVVRMGRVAVQPMSVEEAILKVQDSRHPFLVFRNAESQQVAVLFKRPDGQLGLVETEA